MKRKTHCVSLEVKWPIDKEVCDEIFRDSVVGRPDDPRLGGMLGGWG
jgi:hypothetical protein